MAQATVLTPDPAATAAATGPEPVETFETLESLEPFDAFEVFDSFGPFDLREPADSVDPPRFPPQRPHTSHPPIPAIPAPRSLNSARSTAKYDHQNPPSDIPALVARARSGDAEAFGEIYGLYADSVYRYIYRRVSHRQLAEDLCSETFLRALRRISSFAWQGRDIIAWLQTIARNLVIDHYKSAVRRAETPTDEFDDTEVCKDGPEEALLTALAQRSLYDAMERLVPAQRQCVTLRLLDGHSVDETAHIMGRTRGAITTLQFRALRALERVLREQEGAPAAV
ncbi:MAG TPA: sigma-70 family RNA polymerase sigma factor [Actinocrinis sp.]|nr:sigma-70 family RNA polymerase sigma factor [Actinocrinis sp.]